MSLVVVHLRWDDVDPDQYAEVRRLLPDGDDRPAGCLARSLALQGTVLHGTEVWAGEERARRSLQELPATVAPTGVGEPMTVAFAVPDVYAAAYRQSSRSAPVGMPGVVLPAPRTAAHDAVAGEPLPAGGR